MAKNGAVEALAHAIYESMHAERMSNLVFHDKGIDKVDQILVSMFYAGIATESKLIVGVFDGKLSSDEANEKVVENARSLIEDFKEIKADMESADDSQ